MVYISEKRFCISKTCAMPRNDAFDWVYLFAIGGLIGTVYEVVLNMVLHGIIEDRSGSILTPFNYVYGIGALVIFFVMTRLKKPHSVFLAGSLLGGALEYGLSVFQEVVLGSRSWDYSAKPLNIGGRTTVPYTLVWGALCFVAVYALFPAFLRLIHRMPERVRKQVAVFLLVILIADVAVTATAAVRYSQRAAGMTTQSGWTNIVDNLFDDAFMRLHFPNMRVAG